jgi:3-isopropylmalate/(R)-2-methylmalate dehydratase small subunit
VLAAEAIATLQNPVTLDLEAMTIGEHAFSLPQDARQMLMEGLDPIALTLKHADAIARWQAADRKARPWAWLDAAATDPERLSLRPGLSL